MPDCNEPAFPNDYADNWGMDLAEREAEIAEFQEIAANLPRVGLPHLISVIYKVAFNRGEWQEYCRAGLIRSPDFLQEDAPMWEMDHYNEVAILGSRFTSWTDEALAYRVQHGMPPPSVPESDGDPNYRLPSGRFRNQP